MLTSKQRAYLRGLANEALTIFQIGKAGITEAVCKETDLALEAREIVKIRVLESAGLTAREAADKLCESCGADPVQCIGNKLVLYRKSKKSVITLPD